MHNRPSRNPRSRDWVWVCLLYLAEVTQVMTTHFPTIYEEGDNLHCRTCITITFGITWMGVSSQVFSFFSSSLFFCSHIALFTIKLQLIFNFTWTCPSVDTIGIKSGAIHKEVSKHSQTYLVSQL